MDDDDLLRYSRHILLDDIGIEGQQRIQSSHALIIGAGGLGSPAALYLGSAGVGDITVVDDDTVDLTNLQRQIAHTTARVGQSKVDSLAQAVKALNPKARVHALAQRAGASDLAELVAKADVVLDCCDNFQTRQAINQTCVQHQKPLVSGAAIRFDGQVAVYDTRQAHSPCYACLFAPDADFQETRCATMGVFAPLVGLIGSIQAAEALKLLTGVGQSLVGRLLLVDGRAMAFTEMKVQRQKDCVMCASRGAKAAG